MNIDKLTKLAISRCLTPKKILTPYGEKIVPCGTCSYCRRSKTSRFKILLQNELSVSPAIFFTLSYAPEHLPLVEIQKNIDDNYYCPSFIVSRHTQIKSPYFISTLHAKSVNKTNINIDEYTKYSLINSEDIPNKFIAVYDTKDIQLFLKRLRQLILKKYGETIRYYCLAEYGGKSMRPHYHFIIFGKSAHLYMHLVRRAWTYGFIYNSGTVNVQTFSLTSYLSSYLSSSSAIPSFLNQIRPPKIFHSKNFGFDFLIPFAQDFYKNPALLLNEEFTIYSLEYSTTNPDADLTNKHYTIKTLSKDFVSCYLHGFTKYPNSENPAFFVKEETNYKNFILYSKITLKLRIPLDFINYLFPNIWGRPRYASYLDSVLLNSYDTLHQPENFDLYCKLFLSEPNYFPALGISLNDFPDFDETPTSLLQIINQDSLNFLISTQCTFDCFLDDHSILEKEYISYLGKSHITNMIESQLHCMSKVISRLYNCYYRSKHYCINLKQYFNCFNSYYKTFKKFRDLLDKAKLNDFLNILEYNNTYPYQYFYIEGLDEVHDDYLYPQALHTLLPIQNEYLHDKVKHKEINNRNELLFNNYYNDNNSEIPF